VNAWARGRVGASIRPAVRAWERGRVGAWSRGCVGAWERESVGAWARGRVCVYVCVISSTRDPKLAEA